MATKSEIRKELDILKRKIKKLKKDTETHVKNMDRLMEKYKNIK